MKKFCLLLFNATLLLCFFSCSRTMDRRKENASFQVSDAKYWFENIFKKDDDWAILLSKEKNASSLDWDNAIYNGTENLKIVEIPLKLKPSSISMPKIAASRELVDSVLKNVRKSLIIIKKNDKLSVLQKTYIPDIDQHTKGFDANINRFRGKIFYSSPIGEIVYFNETTSGNKFSSYKVNNNLTTATMRRNTSSGSPYQCVTVELQNYVEICFPALVNLLFTQVNETFSTSAIVCYEAEVGSETISYCPNPENGCSTSECSEQEFLSGYIPPPTSSAPPPAIDTTNCDELAQNAFVNFSDAFEFVNEPPQIIVRDIDANTKSKEIRWTFLRAQNNRISSHVYAVAKGIIKKNNNQWVWDTLAIEKIHIAGIMSGGTIAISKIVGVPSFTSGDPNIFSANIKLKFDLTFLCEAFICGSNIITLPGVTVTVEDPVITFPMITSNPY